MLSSGFLSNLNFPHPKSRIDPVPESAIHFIHSRTSQPDWPEAQMLEKEEEFLFRMIRAVKIFIYKKVFEIQSGNVFIPLFLDLRDRFG
jgi:hypothetical protein